MRAPYAKYVEKSGEVGYLGCRRAAKALLRREARRCAMACGFGQDTEQSEVGLAGWDRQTFQS